MTASASLKRKLSSRFSTSTRKALQADRRSRITDEHPDIARRAAERQEGGLGVPASKTIS